ncbi:hypothetical protein OIPHN330_26940 [Citrobacter freundii]|uniref:hypothetical protein n=1 Tax=Citrobacter freundii TaxID=546 RepID=UPI002B291D19|nr:hypothetical protein OIPHN330_26940 [Citrobacter freundii]BEJ39974.1 hypothetical protein OIPHN354_26860 [Citrobacter freundii]
MLDIYPSLSLKLRDFYCLAFHGAHSDLYGKQAIAGDIHPDNLGLHLQYCDDNEFNNCIQIRGTPTKAGIAKVRVHGGLGGGMFSKSGEFDKTYTITVKDSEGSS